jgi:hypothetical protein
MPYNWQRRMFCGTASSASIASNAAAPPCCLPAPGAVQSLRYSRAAAVVRACSYKLRPGLRAGDLPFVGDVTGGWLRQLPVLTEAHSCQY